MTMTKRLISGIWKERTYQLFLFIDFMIFVRDLYFDLFTDRGLTAETTISRLAKHNIIQYYLDLLYAVTHKTLMLEINYLRMEGKLEGESPEQRYLTYVTDFLGDSEYLRSLVEEYPVMFRLIAEKLEISNNLFERSFLIWSRTDMNYSNNLV